MAVPQATELTDKEHARLVRVGDEFWLEFSELCEKYIRKAPSHLRQHYIVFLGEKTSIYGRKTR
jgi:hypothetical protein